MDENEVISKFVDFLGKTKGCTNLSIDEWPDESNRSEPEIDAIAGKFAVEHTSIDSLPEQRRRDYWYLQVVKNLDITMKASVNCGLTITLCYYDIRRGINWENLRSDLKKWIEECAPLIECGKHKIVLPTSEQIEPPIVIEVDKGSGLYGFSRYVPRDNTLPIRVKKILDRKIAKLSKYSSCYTTVLLVENNDIATMDAESMRRSILNAYSNGFPKGTHEIWFVDTSIPEKINFCDFTASLVSNK